MFYSAFRGRSPHSKTAFGSAIAAALVLAINPVVALAGNERGLGGGDRLDWGAGQGVEKLQKPIAQRQSLDPLPPSLITAMKQDLYQYVYEVSPGQYSSFSGYIFFVDLNGDQIKEAIVYPEIGIPCSNRSCSIFIYTKIDRIYRKISADETDRYSAVAGSRNSPSIGILPTSSRGWYDLATRRFDYDTRTEIWTRSRYGTHGYADSPDVIIPTPQRIVEDSSGLHFDFNTLLVP